MKQKFQIRKSVKKRELLIQEYAVIEATPRRKELQSLHDENFALLSEQTYNTQAVKKSIAEGKESLIALLRNRHFFPVGVYMDRIADSVMALFTLKGEQSEELIIDDREILLGIQNEPDIVEKITDESEIESDDNTEELFKNDLEVNGKVTPNSTDHEPFDEEKIPPA